jgi:hypothetical protein
MAISDTSLSVDVFNTVRSVLLNASITVTNGTATTDTSSAGLYASFNDKNASRPQVIINPIMVDEDSYKFGSTRGKKFINITIDCFYKNTLGIDQMHDQVVNALSSTSIDGIDLVGVTTDVDFDSPGDQKYHRKSGTFTFTRE